MSGDEDNVIHVSFGGPERGRVRPPASRPADAGPRERRSGPRRPPPEPRADHYSLREVARLFGLSEAQLRYWDRSGLLSPSLRSGRRRYYTFQDLIGVRAAKGLLDGGVPLREVRRSVEALRDALPKVTRPLTELRVLADGGTMVVRDEAGSYQPSTGQLVLDFRVAALEQDVVRVLRPGPSEQDRRAAYDYYLEGCRLDEDEATMEEAERCYRKALTLDATLTNALTNLGNIHYRRGNVEEASSFYQQALELDPAQPEAHYNLGFLSFDGGDPSRAAEHFERALLYDPSFADAHFNLAMAYEELGRAKEARPHWETYLSLEPTGAWAEIAQRHLDS